jgi:hypothetical protein
MSNNFFSDYRAFYEIMRENKVEIDRPQTTKQYETCALLAG